MMTRKSTIWWVLPALIAITLIVWAGHEISIRAAETRVSPVVALAQSASTPGQSAVATGPVSGNAGGYTPVPAVSTPAAAQVQATSDVAQPATATPAQPEPTATPVPATPAPAAEPASDASASTIPVSAAPSDLGMVGGTRLNLRAGPATRYPVLRALNAGATFRVLGQDASGSWLYVLLSNGQTGWLYRPFTSYTATAPFVAAPTATPAPAAQSGQPNRPTIQLLAPAAQSTFVTGQQVTVQSEAADSSGVSQIQLLVDNVLVQTTPGGTGQQMLQASQQWQATTPGSHNLTVIATDFSGNSSSASVVVNVTSNDSGPQVQIDQPGGTTVIQAGQGVTIQSTATAGAGVTRIELWADGQLYASANSSNAGGQSPFTVWQQWSSSALGDHTLFVRAYDSAGRSADSGSITIDVADTNPPQVSVSISASTVILGEAVTVHTSASDSKGITRIELWADGAQVAVTSSDSSVGQSSMQADQTWQAGQAGQHSLFVIVYDSVGKSTQSDTRTITVVLPAAPPIPVPPAPAPVPPAPGSVPPLPPVVTPAPPPVPPVPPPVTP